MQPVCPDGTIINSRRLVSLFRLDRGVSDGVGHQFEDLCNQGSSAQAGPR